MCLSYEDIKKKVDERNKMLSVIEGRRAEMTKQLSSIYGDAGVTSLEELKVMEEAKKGEAVLAVAEAEEFLASSKIAIDSAKAVLQV